MKLAASGYRADIDGLRAVAILGVLVFHLRPGLLPGGFLGVDVFFVISGYLITSILWRDLERGRFSIAGFYERRVRRIAPALFCVLLAVSGAALVWLWPADLEAYAKSLKSVVLSLSNFHFLGAALDYFADDTQGVLLLHTWSLAVEEQYYLLFPLLLAGLHRWARPRRRALAVLAGLWLASFAACWARDAQAPMRVFFLLPYRAWELLTGSLLVLAGPPRAGARRGVLMGVAGGMMVLGSLLLVRGGGWLPQGPAALPACLGVALLIRSGADPRVVTARCLAWRPLVGIGLISYSLYLWHWPLIVFTRLLQPAGAAGSGWWVAAASTAAAWASWRWVERPFRRPGFLTRRRVFLGWAGASVLVIAAAAVVREHDGFPGRYPAAVRQLLAFKERAARFKPRNQEHFDLAQAPVYGLPGAAPAVALWGDSHAEALLPGLDAIAREQGAAFVYFGIPGQVPVPGVTRRLDHAARRARYTGEVLDRLRATPALATVVLHARWSAAYCGGTDADPEDLTTLHERRFGSPAELRDHFAGRFRATVAELLAAGKRVVIIGPVPELGASVPDLLARQAQAGRPLQEALPCPDFRPRNGFFLGVLAALPPHPRLVVLLPHRRLMDGGLARVSAAGRPLYRDADHLSAAGVECLRGDLAPLFAPPPAQRAPNR